MVYTHNGMLLSYKGEKNNAICSNMDATRDYHTKWNKLKTNIIQYHIYEKSFKKKKDTNELICRTETHRLCKQTYGSKQTGQRRDGLGVWDWHMYAEVYRMVGHQGPAI